MMPVMANSLQDHDNLRGQGLTQPYGKIDTMTQSSSFPNALSFALCAVLSAGAATAAEKATEKPATASEPAPKMQSLSMPGVIGASNEVVLPPETVLVQIGDVKITQAEVNTETADLEKMMKNRGIPPEQFKALLPHFKAQIIDNLVQRTLINAECATKKIGISDEDVKKELDRFRSNLPKSMTLETVLKQSGLTQKMLENDIREQIKLERLLDIKDPTEDETQAFYEENKSRYFDTPETVHARHILIKTDATASADVKAAARKKADEVLTQLTNGGDFEKLAKEYSDCPSKEAGGDLGEFGRKKMVPEFEQVAFAMKTNEISTVVETQFGYHIIQTLDHNAPKTQSYDDVKARIATMIKGRKIQEKAIPFIDGLKEKTKVAYMNGAEPPAPAAGMMPMPPPSDAPNASTGKDKSAPADKKPAKK